LTRNMVAGRTNSTRLGTVREVIGTTPFPY
jgi:hypothetical protein